MGNVSNNQINDLAAVLNITDDTGLSRLLLRCGFSEKGFLERLNLNGFGLSGSIDIKDFTKHLSVLDIRNNPDLKEVTISVLSDLGFSLNHSSESCCSEVLLKDEDHIVHTAEPGRDLDESPFLYYFLKENAEEHPIYLPGDHSHKNNPGDIRYDEVDYDIHALRAEALIEESLLQTARIGMYLTSRLQSNLDRTCIGMLNTGLDRLRRLAFRFEQIRTVNKLILEIKDGLPEHASNEDIQTACFKKADSFWYEHEDGLMLADLLEPKEADVPVNNHNYGAEGVRLIKSVKNKGFEEYYKALGLARDYYIIGSAYGGSNLRLGIKRFSDRADQLAASIETLTKNIRILETIKD